VTHQAQLGGYQPVSDYESGHFGIADNVSSCRKGLKATNISENCTG